MQQKVAKSIHEISKNRSFMYTLWLTMEQKLVKSIHESPKSQFYVYFVAHNGEKLPKSIHGSSKSQFYVYFVARTSIYDHILMDECLSDCLNSNHTKTPNKVVWILTSSIYFIGSLLKYVGVSNLTVQSMLSQEP